MSMKKTLGGDRLGTGKKMQVDLHGYGKSTHNLSHIVRTTMSAGTLVPFWVEIGLPGDTFDINLDCDCKTHPTTGPLFGSYKLELDVFTADLRLYNGFLHNNKTGIGLTMEKVYFPVMNLHVPNAVQDSFLNAADKDNSQINPSCILKYLGISGIGFNEEDINFTREFNALGIVTYWDVIKNYYTNKQEEIGAVIHSTSVSFTINSAVANGQAIIPRFANGVYLSTGAEVLRIGTVGTTTNPEDLQYVLYETSNGMIPAAQFGTGWFKSGADWVGKYNPANNRAGTGLAVFYVRLAGVNDSIAVTPRVTTFPLENLDKCREAIQAWQMTTPPTAPFNMTDDMDIAPYSYILGNDGDVATNRLQSQEGLAVKTYLSDLYNNWVNTEYIDGTNGINEITAIDTTGGSITVESIILAKKVYNMLNRIAVSGGTYQDWLEVQYDHTAWTNPESPVYEGSLIKEVVFQEVISNTETEGQPLGTIGGRGVLGKKHIGGKIMLKIKQPCMIMGIVSLTPRIDYSQGNDWFVHLKTMAELHVPALDQIGFQDSITEERAWWDTYVDNAGVWHQKSAGKIPAWMNYMTRVNKVYGNFAIPDNEMFMILNRRYEPEVTAGTIPTIQDLTTYIDPSKFNFIFAETALDAQNFWVQIGIHCIARRKMSAKLLPSL